MATAKVLHPRFHSKTVVGSEVWGGASGCGAGELGAGERGLGAGEGAGAGRAIRFHFNFYVSHLGVTVRGTFSGCARVHGARIALSGLQG